MDSQFWIERWSNKQIGFHQPTVNAYLRRFWPALQIPRAATVFVPLCGKSVDMRWLHEQGHRVLGVEVARIAVAEFFQESALEPQVTVMHPFERWQADDYTLLCGDFFDLSVDQLAEVAAVFDRAALVALPEATRKRYVAKLDAVLPQHVQTLLVGLTYPPEHMAGPPFSVSEAEVLELYSPRDVERLADVDVIDHSDTARFRERGVTRMSEQVYRIG
jgi:thiopurine S-methyltransferase